ncbi:MAG TPA: tetratricopeptide repeat protein [Polyangiaceae bacterium]|nr:tetratricopeptide repeat protein [Polyangiaceae bacterium]
MSQIEPTDLLCRSRREDLSADEQRRLNESLQHSFEVKLMSQVLGELEQDSRVRPGDDALLARITARALGAPEKASPKKAPAKRRALSMLLVAAAVLLMASLASALLGRARQRQAVEDSQTIFGGWPWKAAKPGRPPSVLPSVKPIPSQSVQDEPDIAADQVPSSQPPPAPSSSVQRRTGQPAASLGTASELFARANLLRRQGRGIEAAGLYQLLLERHPNSREVAPTRLALAKYFQTKQPDQALAQYRAVASGGGPLRAEALWGISESATSLGQRSLATQALGDLIREFPDSPYAEVARARTTHGLP